MLNIITCISSIVAAIGTIGCIIVSIVLYKKQCKNEALAKKRRQEEERQDLLDELNAMNEHSPFPYTSEVDRLIRAKANYLNRRLNRR